MNLKRGLSTDQVCVLTAIDRSKNLFGKSVGYGKMRASWINDLSKNFKKDSILVTDGDKSYDKTKDVNHKKFVDGLSKGKTPNLGGIDNLHTDMKNLINRTFKVVATKHLDNYVLYNSVLKQHKDIFINLC